MNAGIGRSGPAAATGLPGKVVLVTGASRGIGAGIARAFADAGATVVLAARDTERLTQVVQAIRATGGTATAVPTDITDPAAVQRLIETTLSVYGRLDAAVNNAAGGGHRPTALAEVDPADLDTAYATQVRGTFLCLKHQIPAMLGTARGGAIVNMASTAGLEAVSGLAAYSSAKAAVIALTRVAALDYGSQGLRVNALAPGPILTDHLAAAGEQVREQAAQAIPLGRIGTVAEVASTTLWLCSDAATYITGATITIDGGKTAGSQALRRPGTLATSTSAQPEPTPPNS